jgi:hypothetical protein
MDQLENNIAAQRLLISQLGMKLLEIKGDRAPALESRYIGLLEAANQQLSTLLSEKGQLRAVGTLAPVDIDVELLIAPLGYLYRSRSNAFPGSPSQFPERRTSLLS